MFPARSKLQSGDDPRIRITIIVISRIISRLFVESSRVASTKLWCGFASICCTKNKIDEINYSMFYNIRWLLKEFLLGLLSWFIENWKILWFWIYINLLNIYIYKFIKKFEQHFPNYENTIERNNYSTFVNRSKCDGENIIWAYLNL